MSTQAEVDATVVGCMIDAFMVIVAERNRFHLPLDVTDRKENQSTAQKEVIDLILSGEVSKNYLQEIGQTNIVDLWQANINVLAGADVFGERKFSSYSPDLAENNIVNQVSELPQHFSRLLGAFFSTFEVLAMGFTDSSTEEEEQEFYRTGTYPESISSELSQYVESSSFKIEELNNSNTNSNNFDGDESALIDNILGTKLDAPIVSPFKPYISASFKDSVPNKALNVSEKGDWLETSDDASLALSPISASEPPLLIENKIQSEDNATQPIVDDEDDNDDGMSVSITENSILDSYYNNDYKIWNMDPSNIPVEEDEDSDREQIYNPSGNLNGDGNLNKTKQPSQTRMRANVAVGGARNYMDDYNNDPPTNENSKTGRASKAAKFVKKRVKTVRKVMNYQSYPSSGEESGLDDDNERVGGDSMNRINNKEPENSVSMITGRKDKEVRFASEYDDFSDNKRNVKTNNNVHEAVPAEKNSNVYNFGKYVQSDKKSTFSSLLSDSESSVDLSDKEPSAGHQKATRGPHLAISDGEEDDEDESSAFQQQNKAPVSNFKERSLQRQRRNPLDMSLEGLPPSNGVSENEVLAFSILDVEDSDDEQKYVPKISYGLGRENNLSKVEEVVEEKEETQYTIASKSKPVVWKSVAVRKSQEEVSVISKTETVAAVISSPVLISIPKVNSARPLMQPLSDDEEDEDITSTAPTEKPMNQNTFTNMSPPLHPSNDTSPGLSMMTVAAAKPPLPPAVALSVSVDTPQQSMDSQVWMTRQASISPRLPPPQNSHEKHNNQEAAGEEKVIALKSSSDRQNTIEKLRANILEKRRRSEAASSSSALNAEAKSTIDDEILDLESPSTSNQQLSNESALEGKKEQQAIITLPTTNVSLSINSAASFRSERDNNNDNVNVNMSASDLYLQLLLPEHFQPPPLSDFAEACGVIVEGYLNKKSAVTGLWQKRYFVLAESASHYCVLRIFGRAVETQWGNAPLNCKTSIPISNIERVDTVAAKNSKGREFTIKFSPQRKTTTPQSSSRPSSSWLKGASTGAADSPNGSVNSDMQLWQEDNTLKVTTLQADEPQTRLLWVTMLNRALSAYWVDLE